MNWRVGSSLDGGVAEEATTWRQSSAAGVAVILMVVHSVMCDAGVNHLQTSFTIEDIIASDDDKTRQPHLPVSADHHVPEVVRPWEMQTTSVMGASGETCLRLTARAAALMLYHWQAINSVSPLCELYKMTTSNFVDSLNGDRLQGWIYCVAYVCVYCVSKMSPFIYF